MSTTPTSGNRLANETSPYLLQHAHNPVDWYPWGPEALELAEKQDKPIFLSVGYSACHWCHVMERESFEDARIAKLLNEHYVCIKVDREERPDIDDVYMAATIALTGHGGWPMSVFLTPERAPFFAGTYFPPRDREGQPGFERLIVRIADLWESDRDQLFRQAGELLDHIQAQSELDAPANVTGEVIERAVLHLAKSFDGEWGGFGNAPKFPPSQALQLLLSHHQRTANPTSLRMVVRTLDAMKDGGIYDQLRGGFARYSTDREWLAPHFEKMLYDNAELAKVYVAAHQVTGDREYERVARETLDYIMDEMQSPQGGYYSATDADSEGVEGKYFTFTTKELRQHLEAEETRVFAAFYNCTETGNWEGTNILHVRRPLDEVARSLNVDVEEAAALLRSARAKLLDARKRRVPPHLDDKILVSWNGLMIGAMAEAHRVLGDERHLESATRAATFIWDNLRAADEGLLRTFRDGKAHVTGFLEDYAYLCDAFIDLYETRAGEAWLARAESLGRGLLTRFLDPDTGTFFQTPHDAEALIVRLRDGNDGALPNANAVAARALWRLGHHFAEDSLIATATAALRAHGQRIERLPRAHLTSLNVIDAMLAPALSLVYAGERDQLGALEREVAAHYLPRRVIAYAGSSEPLSRLARGKTPSAGRATLYVCRDQVCAAPVTSPSAVAALLRDETSALAQQRRRWLQAERVVGRATPEATARYFEQRELSSDAPHPLGNTGLYVARVAVGGYRLNDSERDAYQALLFALRNGCNLVDTAPAYGNGASQRAIGNAISELLRAGDLEREQVVVMNKLGMQSGASAGATAASAANGEASSGYSLDLDKLAQQLQQSLTTLNLSFIDVCLLHNPELAFVETDAERAWQRLEAALSWLEQQRSNGLIGVYGISSNALTLDGASTFGPTLTRLAEIVTGNGLTGFAVLQLPLNPLEHRVWDDGVVKRAADLGWAVVTNRPLNAVVGDDLVRLAEVALDREAPPLDHALQRVSQLEGEFSAKLGSLLEAAGAEGPSPKDLFAWGTRVGLREVSNRGVWNEFEQSTLLPELGRVVSSLDQAFDGTRIGGLWRDFKKRYLTQVEHMLRAARAEAAVHTQTQTEPVRQRFESLESLPPKASLAQRVVACLGQLPGVSSVLVGTRSVEQTREVIETLTWGSIDTPEAYLLDAAFVSSLVPAKSVN
jgi:hypothetical protein